jgi:hypothetical protein
MLRALKTPARIQQFVDAITYQYADTAWSPQRVLRERKGHCLEGALLAAAALRVNGYPPLLMDLEAVRDDDHVVAIYREGGLWGSIANMGGRGTRECSIRSHFPLTILLVCGAVGSGIRGLILPRLAESARR